MGGMRALHNFVRRGIAVGAVMLSCMAVTARQPNFALQVLPCSANAGAAMSFAWSNDARTLLRRGDLPLAGDARRSNGFVRFETALPPGHYFVNVRTATCAAQVAVRILGSEHRTFFARMEKGYAGPLDLWQNSLAGTLPISGVPSVVLMSSNDDVQMAAAVVEDGRYYFEYLKPMKYNLRVLSQDGTRWSELSIDLRDPHREHATRNLTIHDLAP